MELISYSVNVAEATFVHFSLSSSHLCQKTKLFQDYGFQTVDKLSLYSTRTQTISCWAPNALDPQSNQIPTCWYPKSLADSTQTITHPTRTAKNPTGTVADPMRAPTQDDDWVREGLVPVGHVHFMLSVHFFRVGYAKFNQRKRSFWWNTGFRSI